MNIYLCSTVRHLMLSLLRSVDEPQQKSTILVIVDQQNLKVENFNLACLSQHIDVKFIYRKEILSSVYRGFSGVCLKVVATCNVKPIGWLKEHTRKVVIEKELMLSLPEQSSLFLFNDRNRLSRLLRLSFDSYSVLEDGLSNYSGMKLSIFDKLLNFFNGNKNKYRYIGDSSRCKDIWLLNVDKAPKEILFKAKSIDFIKTNNVKAFCHPFFKVDESLDDSINCIIATQPISVSGLTKSNYDLTIYRRLVELLNKKSKTYVFKVHPRECIDRYTKAFPEAIFIKSKVPLELIVCGLKNKATIYSIYSSAGMGFESFCTRKTIIDENEASYMVDVFDSWQKDENKLEDRLKNIV